MSANKNQHYVPKAHMRPFCPRNGEAINLYNISGDRLVGGASIKGQCSRNFFYGKDGELERLLQSWEGNYATAVSKAMADPALVDEKELSDIRDFAVLQTLRTFGCIEKNMKMFDQLEGDIKLAGKGKKLPAGMEPITLEAAMRMAIAAFPKAAKSVSDLDACIVVNETAHEFITSDDPAIHSNRFHFQRLQRDGFGLGSAGAMLFLPLAPKLYFMAFDKGVYRVPERRGNLVTVRSADEVASFNELQHLHARENLYYSGAATGEGLPAEFKKFAGRRPAEWHVLRYLEKIGESTHGEHFISAESLALEPGREFISMFHQVHVRPNRWPDLLKYRLRPKFVETGTGAGCIRPTSPAFPEWKIRQTILARKRLFGKPVHL
ncbi:DUF4238 domain-containing protein [Methylocystis sp. H4A]|uniref:DUF4238 domain-containing protein n=1 Tax=Methylocystis sp. H4A TaxID=2785788 RepID=UPI0018C1F77A|nr:DUF4238 domain-containing protein [Methylocystis sp. H4A]MBG0801254.1 DUF4238 domain-containing protein [Methylocystis sp. H4A]